MTSISSVYSHNNTAKNKIKLHMMLLARPAQEPVIRALEVRANSALWTCPVFALFSKTTSKGIKLLQTQPKFSSTENRTDTRYLLPGEKQVLAIPFLKCS